MKLLSVKNAWCLYDWANSVYLLVITSTIFPVYYNGVTRAAYGSDTIEFFGYEIVNSVLYSYSLSISFLIVAMLSPLLSGIADISGRKKTFLRSFTYLGALSSIALYWFDGNNVEYGILFSVLASIGYSGSLVFYNAFLPEIASASDYDKLSARGYAFGYVGSVLLLLFNLLSIQYKSYFGFELEQDAVRFAFLTVGVWWLVFAQISLYYLPDGESRSGAFEHLIFNGYKEVIKVFHSLKNLPALRVYLISFLFYSTGVQTVMFLAATFGDKELHLEANMLIMTILIIQLVAIAGAYLFAYLSSRFGNQVSIGLMISIWILICIYAYFIYEPFQFYSLAFFVGLVMGGIQSISRSTYSKLIPDDSIDNTSYFSFYDVIEKVSIVLGTFSYGLIEQLTGSMRNSTIALTIYFIIGLAFLYKANIQSALRK